MALGIKTKLYTVQPAHLPAALHMALSLPGGWGNTGSLGRGRGKSLLPGLLIAPWPLGDSASEAGRTEYGSKEDVEQALEGLEGA